MTLDPEYENITHIMNLIMSPIFYSNYFGWSWQIMAMILVGTAYLSHQSHCVAFLHEVLVFVGMPRCIGLWNWTWGVSAQTFIQWVAESGIPTQVQRQSLIHGSSRHSCPQRLVRHRGCWKMPQQLLLDCDSPDEFYIPSQPHDHGLELDPRRYVMLSGRFTEDPCLPCDTSFIMIHFHELMHAADPNAIAVVNPLWQTPGLQT